MSWINLLQMSLNNLVKIFPKLTFVIQDITKLLIVFKICLIEEKTEIKK